MPHDGETLGEIIVRGNVVMKGYYNDAGATDAALKWLVSLGRCSRGPSRWLRGDSRRFKDVIISGGENISSVEVEGCLLRHATVQEVAVVGMPHDRWEIAARVCSLKDGSEATEDELKQHVRDNLAHFKTPQWVSFVDELPKTATGKVQKFVLRGNKSGITRQ